MEGNKMRFITVNGNRYNARPIDLNTICDLEDMGIQLSDWNRKRMSFIRGYIGICMGVDMYTAGNELQAHLVNGGTVEDYIKVIAKEVEESDFFRSLQQNAEATATANS